MTVFSWRSIYVEGSTVDALQVIAATSRRRSILCDFDRYAEGGINIEVSDVAHLKFWFWHFW